MEHTDTPQKAHQHEIALTILVEAEGLEEIISLQLHKDGTGHDLVALVAEKVGFGKEEALLFYEDEETLLDLTKKLTEKKAHDKVHHVHRVKQIEVTVSYQGIEKHKTFPPSARIQRVLDWAVKSFKIDPAIAPEMELALHGQTVALPKNAHIGRYVRHPQHKLALDLIRGVVPNGSSE